MKVAFEEQSVTNTVNTFTCGPKCQHVVCVFAYCSVPCEEEPSAFSDGCQPCDTHQGVGGGREVLEKRWRRF